MHRAIALLLILTVPVLAQSSEWASLKALRPGEKIWIRYKADNKVRSAKGEMVRWTEDTLVVRTGRTERVLARADVRRVAVYAGKSRGKGAGIGAVVGGGAGAVFYGIAAAATYEDLEVSPALIVAAGALLFAGVGALIGLAVGSTKTRTLYEVPAP
jgi:hypothetical protein